MLVGCNMLLILDILQNLHRDNPRTTNYINTYESCAISCDLQLVFLIKNSFPSRYRTLFLCAAMNPFMQPTKVLHHLVNHKTSRNVGV
jgi:hypothetical protein